MKYLGLLAMSKILRTHPKSVQAHKDLILQCLDDKDESIRLRALDLLYGMVSKKTLMEIVKRLMVHMDKAEGTSYRDELLSKIVQICSQGNYQYITNFEWYVSVLVELTRVEALGRQGSLVAGQLLDVAIRVAAIRPFATRQMALLLDNAHFLASGAGGSSGDGAGCGALASSVAEVLHAAAWICGEFSQHLPSPVSTLEAMLRGGRLPSLPGHTQAVFVHNVLKLYAAVISRPRNEGGDPETIEKNMYEFASIYDELAYFQISELLIEKLPHFASSGDLEVQERASSALQIVKLLAQKRKRLREKKGAVVNPLEDGLVDGVPGSEEENDEMDPYTIEFISLFRGELNPVAPKAQKKVQVPDGLDLDAWINEPPSESSTDEEDIDRDGRDIFGHGESGLKLFSDGRTNHPVSQNLSEEELQRVLNSPFLEMTERLEQRYCIKFCQKLGDRKWIPNGFHLETIWKIQTAFGDDAMGITQIKEWYNRFKDGRTSVESEQGSGHPKHAEMTRREARRLEQANNPHYLKGGGSRKSNDTSVSEIPVAPIELSTPLHIAGLASSDKYLNLDRKKTRKKTKKVHKKGKRSSKANGVSASDDEDDEPPVVHAVNTDIGEMPEGVELSEGEEEDSRPSDDPHRALDINLDEPLRDEEKLPVAKHRSGWEKGTRDDSDTEVKPKKKKEKAKEKKKHGKKERKKEKVPEEENRERGDGKEEIIKEPKENKKPEDIDMWLMSNDHWEKKEGAVEEAVEEIKVEETVEEEKKHRKKKKKDGVKESCKLSKEERKKKKRREGEGRGGEPEEKQTKSKEGYEEAAGISTPSKEAVVMEMVENGRVNKARKLAEDKSLLLTLEWRGAYQVDQGSVSVNGSITLMNRGVCLLKRLDLNLSESPAVKPLNGMRNSHLSMVPPDSNLSQDLQVQLLHPGTSVEMSLTFVVSEPTIPHKLRATLTYIADQGSSGSSHEKLDMWLHVPCSSYLLSSTAMSSGQMNEGSFADLLSSGDLVHRRSISITAAVNVTFPQMLKLLCSGLGFILVEQVGDSASLYACSAQGQHICMLAKGGNPQSGLSLEPSSPLTFNFEGKSDCESLLVNLLEEIRTILSPQTP
ncbi:hypothetical protein J437_LFUL015474 [Ladona fulva]|uniref:AP-3 complex subunit delta domain-containing protein n=1 Tax=Ladona fulva TaxID=123851 RepID=A0A8K0KLG1_LADFU|nr:hypothetical protein J437_LFUL015474 [Ladona fulva]